MVEWSQELWEKVSPDPSSVSFLRLICPGFLLHKPSIVCRDPWRRGFSCCLLINGEWTDETVSGWFSSLVKGSESLVMGYTGFWGPKYNIIDSLDPVSVLNFLYSGHTDCWWKRLFLFWQNEASLYHSIYLADLTSSKKPLPLVGWRKTSIFFFFSWL